MTTINDLSSTATLAEDDSFPVWRAANSDTRKATIGTLQSYIQDNLIYNPDYAIKPVATYAALTALVTATGLADNGIYYTYGRAAEEDGGAGFWRYDSASTATANGGTILAIDGGGAGRFFRLFAGDVYLTWFCTGNTSGTAIASLTDNRSLIQAAFDYCYSTGHALFVPAGKQVYAASENGSNGYCILNEGVSVKFEEAPTGFNSCFTFANGIGSSVDFMKCRPRSGGSIDLWLFRWVYIETYYGSAARGRRGLYFSFDQACGVLDLIIDRCRGGVGGGYTLETYSDDALNPQGVPFGMEILGGYFPEGIKCYGVSDSFTCENAFIRSTTSSGRIGFDVQTVTTVGARALKGVLSNANIDADGGAVRIRSGWGWNLENLDIEQTRGTVTSVVDLSGSDDPLYSCTIDGLMLGVFGTAAVTNMLRVDTATKTQIRAFNIITAATGGGFTAPTNAILVTANAADTVIDRNGSYIYPGRFTNDINDAGTRTTYSVIAPASTDNAVARYDGTTGQLQNSGVTISDTGIVTLVDGAAATPATRFASQNTGWWYATSAIGLAVNGVSQWQFGQHLQATNGGKILVGNGTAAAPTLTFANDSDNGFYYIGTNNFGIAVAGALVADWSTSGLNFATGIRINLQNSQSTVGAAGGASALPATPTGYIPIKVAGTEFVVPYYAKT